MQKTSAGIRVGRYRERLSPSLWVLVAAAVCGPMVALVFVPVDTTISLVLGAAAGVAVVSLLVVLAPVIEVTDGMLRAGRARIDTGFLGTPQGLTGDSAREARGPGLDRRAWHLLRGGIDGVVIVPIDDPDDPAPQWVLSTRTPDRLVAAIEAAKATRRTPGR